MRSSKHNLILIISAVLLAVIFVVIFFLQSLENRYRPPEMDASYEQEYVHGKIVKTSAADEEGGMDLKVEMLAGDEEGKIRDVRYDSFNNFIAFKEGDVITVYRSINTDSGDATYTAVDYFHMNGIAWMFAIFVLAAVAVAGKKGVRAIASVLLALGFFYFFFLKLAGVGFSPVWGVLIFTAIVTLISIPLIHGLNRKSLASIIAIFIGYGASLLVVYGFTALAGLGSAPGEDFRLLGTVFADINLGEILLASLFLGAVGALIDTAISISSAIFETLQESPHTNFKKVYGIGMNVGKDVLGSMINTLLFAYLASSLPFFVLLSLSQESGDNMFYNLMNMDFIALELTRTFIGAVSLVILIPLVSATSAYYLLKGKAERG